MERTYKTWGEKWLIFKNDLNEVSILYLEPGQRCSWHNHDKKYNLFFVVDGEINIQTEWGTALVKQGQIFTTRPGEWHEFQTTENKATVIEVMYVQYDSEDINREKVGGMMSKIGDSRIGGVEQLSSDINNVK